MLHREESSPCAGGAADLGVDVLDVVLGCAGRHDQRLAGDTTSAAAISLFVSPRATSSSTCISRSLRPAGRLDRMRAGPPAASTTLLTQSGSRRPALASATSRSAASSGVLAGRCGRRWVAVWNVSAAARIRAARGIAGPCTPWWITAAVEAFVLQAGRSAPAVAAPASRPGFVPCGTDAAESVPSRPGSAVPACPRSRWRQRRGRGREAARPAAGRRPPVAAYPANERRARPARRPRTNAPACTTNRGRPCPRRPGRVVELGVVMWRSGNGSAASTASHTSDPSISRSRSAPTLENASATDGSNQLPARLRTMSRAASGPSDAEARMAWVATSLIRAGSVICSPVSPSGAPPPSHRSKTCESDDRTSSPKPSRPASIEPASQTDANIAAPWRRSPSAARATRCGRRRPVPRPVPRVRASISRRLPKSAGSAARRDTSSSPPKRRASSEAVAVHPRWRTSDATYRS